MQSSESRGGCPSHKVSVQNEPNYHSNVIYPSPPPHRLRAKYTTSHSPYRVTDTCARAGCVANYCTRAIVRQADRACHDRTIEPCRTRRRANADAATTSLYIPLDQYFRGGRHDARHECENKSRWHLHSGVATWNLRCKYRAYGNRPRAESAKDSHD